MARRTALFAVAAAAMFLAAQGCSSPSRDHSGNNNGDGDGGAGDATTTGDGGGEVDAAGPPPDEIHLTGTMRDFNDTHPDFEAELGVDPGIVAEDLGADGKPVYAGGTGTATTHGEDAFNQWYRDVPGVNMPTQFTITLDRDANGLYTYDNQAFFPIDDQLFGNQGRNHNFHFTYELNTEFTYKGGEIFRFTGDDDLFVFINGKLAIDLGGVHGSMSQEVNLDADAAYLGITPGNTYTLDFFFAERHTVESHFRIDTTIDDLTPIVQ